MFKSYNINKCHTRVSSLASLFRVSANISLDKLQLVAQHFILARGTVAK